MAAAKPSPAREGGRGPLLEREREREILAAAIGRAAAGEGSLVLIEGSAGIGKTTLLAAATETARERGLLVRAARGGALERGMPFGLARQLFEPVIARASEAERERLLAGSAGLALAALGRSDPDGGAPGDPFAPIHGLYWLLANLAEAAPVLLAVDDLHWADSQTLRFLDYLSRRLADTPALVIACVRLGEPAEPPELAPLRLTAELLHLEPLTTAAVAELLAAELGAEPDADFVESCVGATAGNPFLLAELVRSVRADALEPSGDAAAVIAELGPKTVARQVLTRLERFGDGAVALARAIAVLGGAPQLRHAARLADLNEARASHLCDRLREAEVLAPGLPLDFVHPLVRHAVYGDISEAERSAAHRRAAEILDESGTGARDLVPHLVACEPNGDQWVVARLREAAQDANGTGGYSSAEAYLERALAEPPREELPVLFELGLVLIETDPSRAPGVLAGVAERTPDRTLRVTALHEAAFAYGNALDFERSVDCFTALLGELTESDREQALLAESQRYCVRTVSAGRDLAEADHIRKLAAHLGTTTRGACVVRQAAAFDRFLACEPVDEVVELASSFPPPPLDLTMRAITPLFACKILAWSGRWDQARFLMSFLADTARDEGELVVVSIASGILAEIDRLSGRLVDSEGAARTAWEIARASAPQSYAEWNAIVNLLATLIARGDLDQANRLAAGIDLSAGFAGLGTNPAPIEVRGYLRLAQGEVESGLDDLFEYGDQVKRLDMNNPSTSPWEQEAALALAALGRTAEAEELITEAERRARAFGATHVIGTVLRSRGLIEPRDRARETLRESVAALETYGPPHELARSLLELGAALRRGGNRSEAREPLHRALELAHVSGAGAVERRTREELAAIGSRPRSVFRAGVGALTASELRTARLAAEGLSNVEIAQRLFVTRKTVEKHLSNAYAKLEIGSREELPAVLDQ